MSDETGLTKVSPKQEDAPRADLILDEFPVSATLTLQEARLLYAILWYAVSYGDAKAFCLSLLHQADKQSPELQLQADEVGNLSNKAANILRKFGMPPLTRAPASPPLEATKLLETDT